jgi:Mn2+/Fe2+ NRAMP family transporter
MNDEAQNRDLELLESVANKGAVEKARVYTRLSGPGWLQAAITLGGGSLAGSLFLGVILGYNMMWLQPLAMILGVIMLSAAAYVTLTTGERPFKAIKEHVSPVLGWAWLIAAAMANIVWCLPQFALGSGAIQQNLIPGLADSTAAPWAIGAVLLVLASIVVRAYDSGSRGIKFFEVLLKLMVGVVVVSFFVVVAKLTISGVINWGTILKGLIPNLSYLFKPAPVFADAIAATGDNAPFWEGFIQSTQKDKIIAAFGTAVGINMTFLLPYSMLKKKWGKPHRGLAIFDLSIGLIIPFMIATGCIVIASASQFHGKSGDILNEDGTVISGMESGYYAVADELLAAKAGDEFTALQKEKKAAEEQGNAAAAKAAGEEIQAFRDGLPMADRTLAAFLVDRKDRQLALALRKLAGEGTGRFIFGIGVLGMALSTIIILMLINGFCLCEACNRPGDRHLHFLGSLIPGIVGLCFPVFWTADSRAAFAIPTSVIGSSLLPIAYFTFFLLMNSRSLLGEARPTGGRRIWWNLLMFIATALATVGSVWAIKNKELEGIPAGKIGIGILIVLFVVGTVGFLQKERRLTR